VVAHALATIDRSDAVIIELGEELPLVLADPGLLERVVANVVDNGLRHARSAAMEVRGSAHAGRVELRVCDHGPGLLRGAADAVFAPFQRLGSIERGDRQTASGIGLGLSVAKGFMEAMGGVIAAEDTPGRRAHRGDLVARCQAAPGRAARFAGGCGSTGSVVTRVLVVDDEPQIVRALRINLTARGYHVLTAPSGTAALQAVAEGHPDVVVLDLGLPDLDGTEVIAGVRGWSSVPIIVLSARTDSSDKVEALDAGADDYITKPFGMDELLARLRAAVRRRAVGTGTEEPVVTTTSFTVDLAAKKVHREGMDVRLTPTEWAILEQLARHPGRLVSQQQLLTEVWGPAYAKETHYLRVYLAQLRRKLEPDPSHPRHLRTEPGMGYRFEP